MGHQHSKSPLSIRISTSNKQSDQLFDFHQSPVKQDEKTLQDTSFLVAFEETVKLVDDHLLSSETETIPEYALFKIIQDPYQQITITPLQNSFTPVLWRVIKQTDAYPLKVGEWIKIGKLQMQLKRIVCDQHQRTTQEFSQKDPETGQEAQVKSAHSQKGTNPNCRICFQPKTLKNDPLVCLCKCTGSIQHTHFQCLKDWIKTGFEKRQQKGLKVYSYDEISCELCKQKLPLSFTLEGKDFSFFDDMQAQTPYAQFESVPVQSGKKKFSRYMIDLGKQKQVMIGRNNICQVTLKDISISRVHCSLEFKHGMLLLRDKKSKFGTLVKVKQPIEFTSEYGVQFQFGSHLIQLYKRHLLKGFCCFNLDNYKVVFDGENNSHERPQRRRNAQSLQQNVTRQQEETSEIGLSLLRTRFLRDEHI